MLYGFKKSQLNYFLPCIKFLPLEFRSICPSNEKSFLTVSCPSKLKDTSYGLAARTSSVNLCNMTTPLKYLSIEKLLWQIETESKCFEIGLLDSNSEQKQWLTIYLICIALIVSKKLSHPKFTNSIN